VPKEILEAEVETSREDIQYIIRRTEPGDYEAVYRIFCGPRAVWGTLQVPFPSAEFWRKRLAEPRDGSYQLAACVGKDVVGQLGVDTFPNYPRRRHVAEIGMAVADEWQGKGVGSALMQAAVDLADKWLNISRLELEVYTDNEPAVRLYKKFGFAVEGKLIRFAYRDGEYVDAYCMARLRDG
jgi:L-phenylalanine/L-methionine N-acetyltransferase